MIEFNFKYALSSIIGENGIEETEIRSLEKELVAARRNLNELRRTGDVGFYDEISNVGMVKEVKDAAEKLFSGDINALYVFGMGGSSLGAMFLKEAMEGMGGGMARGPRNGMDINVIFSENIDPMYIKNNIGAERVFKALRRRKRNIRSGYSKKRGRQVFHSNRRNAFPGICHGAGY